MERPHPFLSGPDVDLDEGLAPSITVRATPFDGEHDTEVVALYRPIYTGASVVYVAAPVTRASTAQTRAASMNKTTGATIEDVQLLAAAHDSNAGHRGVSVVESGGDVWAAAGGHQAAWRDQVSTSGALADLAATANPSGSATLSYYRHIVDPHTGDLYVTVRLGNTAGTVIYRWTAGAWVEWADIADTGSYGGELGFASDGTIYAVTAFVLSPDETGFPRRHGMIVRTIDDGATWQRLDGTSVTLPLTRDNAGTGCFPIGDFNLLNIAVDADDLPVVVAAYRPTQRGKEYRELWQATWDGTAMVHRRIVTHGSAGIGDVSVGYHDGTIIAAVGSVSPHDDPQSPTGPFTGGALWLLVTDDGADTWTRYVLDAGTDHSGAYVDPSSLAVDGVVRLLPMNVATPTSHELWELTLP